MRYDIAVVGNDEAAFEILCVAGIAGQRSIGILPEQRHSAWIVSLALRRLVSQLLVDHSRTRQKLFTQSGTPRLLHRLLAAALTAEVMDHIALLEGLGVDVLVGEARLQTRNSVLVTSGMEYRRTLLHAENIVIGSGTRRTAMHRPLGLVPFHHAESLLSGTHLPRQLCLLGGDEFGAGLAALMSLFGVQTKLVASEKDSSVMLELAEAAGVMIRPRATDFGWNPEQLPSSITMDIVDCRRSVGFTEHLGLPGIGVEPDEHGQLWCAANLETWCSGIFGIGEVVGFSADISKHPTDQAQRILNRITHRIRKPHFLRLRTGALSRL
jgi:NAD(P) transhydrogenase